MVREMERDAVISEDGVYRYLLRRVWDHTKPRALVIMLNPSTADHLIDDATIRSLIRLLIKLGYGSFEVVNLYAFRATDPAKLLTAADPVGPRNDEIIESAIGRCDIAICGWGAFHFARQRITPVMGLLSAHRPAIYCWGTTKNGSPRHPLYVPTNSEIVIYDHW